MSRASRAFLAVTGLLSLAACDVKVNQPNTPPTVVEKHTTVIETKKPDPVKVDINVKDNR